MVTIKLDNITFRLKEYHDFSWLKKYGTAFWQVDQTGSGCLCIGMEQDGRKYFCKIAGANTIEAEVSPEVSIEILKKAVPLYRDLAHPNLVKLVEAYPYERFYVAVFEWAEGDCLFDHWNFEKYQADSTLKSPKDKFKELPAEKKLRAAEALFSFLQNTAEQGYVAVDFYDGSLLYDFDKATITICDIDLFEKAPVVNHMGADWYGTKRLKAPEEYELGSAIDQRTNLFTLGALLFDFFGEFSAGEMERRYMENRFLPCSLSKWQLNDQSYHAAKRAVSPKREERYETVAEFFQEWKEAVK